MKKVIIKLNSFEVDAKLNVTRKYNKIYVSVDSLDSNIQKMIDDCVVKSLCKHLKIKPKRKEVSGYQNAFPISFYFEL